VQNVNDPADDLHDSDGDNGMLHAGFSTIAFTTKAFGQNNHTLDFGFYKPEPLIDIEKATNAVDADVAPGPLLDVGDAVTWSYVITNIGNEILDHVSASDDQEGVITCPKTTLAVSESMTCTSKNGTAVLGAYENNGSVTADGNVSGLSTSDSDLSHYTVPEVSIGSVVWNDLDNDGIQDAGESGISGVVVTLLDNAGVPVAGVATQTTVANGRYYFDHIPEGDYKVQIDMSGTNGYTPSNTQVVNANNDVDNDSNIAETLAGGIYRSGTVTLTNDGEPTEANGLAGTDDADNADDDNGNMTVDFGFYKPVPRIDIQKATNTVDADVAPGPLLHVGDDVNWTYVVTNTGNEQLDNIVVSDDKGVVVTCPQTMLAIGASMTCTGTGTAVLGAYENNGSVTADGNVSGLSTSDSDLSHYTGHIFDLALTKTLAEGQSSSVAPGESVTFTITIYNQGTLDATNIQISDYIPTGLALNDGAWSQAGTIATLKAPIAILAGGASTTVNITFTLAADFSDNSLRNFAEISSADNAIGVLDEDSTMDDDEGNDGAALDDEINNTNNDEDDHDYAEIHTFYHIGTHFWIDQNDNNTYDGPSVDKPIAGAKVELLDENGNKLYWTDDKNTSLTTDATAYPAETVTSADGEYGFDVPAGTYRVHFEIPQSLKDEGYDFVDQGENSDDNVNVSTANTSGITKTVTLGGGNGSKSADLTLDAAVNCACSGITSDSGDALSTLSLLLMLLLTLSSGLLFVRREEV
jgi:uncharacterized repeat protein (TIGR01451 family)